MAHTMCPSISILFPLILTVLINQYAQALESEHIVGGTKAVLGDFKYHVTLNIGNKRCSGAIITDWHIITAAQCITDDQSTKFLDDKLTIIAGVNRLNSRSWHRVDAYAQKYYVPLNFFIDKFFPFSSDIAVIQLTQRLDFRNNYYLTNVERTYESLDYANLKANVSGSGLVKAELTHSPDGREQISGELGVRITWTQAITYSVENCNTKLNFVNGKHICAQVIKTNSNKSQGMCYGEAGAPLVYQGYLLGILVANMNNCDETFIPAVYTRVLEFQDFIKHAIDDRCDLPDLECHVVKT